ncbi:hypothetical protein PPO43_13220 [Saprospira sp. CCB-QB6]|uniref:hypothetical protein n=1 Tax=Saprospira sp. CCB-QB6 TaxID=3023936 RepID=UPI002349225F|nr:hypothetical protein [Saprospira sp. CCB-QB6]WCL80929.1 hypothetical protein PPO43_13220 [Saprospira sp. CCB-QB6]
MFKAVEDFNPLRTIDVEWGCCMAAGFNLQPQLAGPKGRRQRPNESPATSILCFNFLLFCVIFLPHS